MNHLPFIRLCNKDLTITVSDIRKLPIGGTGIIVYFECPNKSGLDYNTMECYIREDGYVSKMVNIVGFSLAEVKYYKKIINALSVEALEVSKNCSNSP